MLLANGAVVLWIRFRNCDDGMGIGEGGREWRDAAIDDDLSALIALLNSLLTLAFGEGEG